MKTTVTAADLARAERLKSTIIEPLAKTRELAAILAEIREEAISCAVVRVERLFAVDERKQLRLPTPEVEPENEGGEDGG